MKIYAFDVDDTLEVSAGPISIVSVGSLRAQGHIVGLNGNWAAVVQTVPVWHRIFSFIGPMEMSKAIFLNQLKTYIRADDYIMVGNIKGVSGASDDEGAANLAGWRFIKEVTSQQESVRDFKKGLRETFLGTDPAKATNAFYQTAVNIWQVIARVIHSRLSAVRLAVTMPRVGLERFDKQCPQCGGPLTIIAAILDPIVIATILAHLGLLIRAPPQGPRRRLSREGHRLNTWRVGKKLCEIFLYQMDEDLSRAR